MDKEEVQLRLAGYRPELYADDDPLIAEALRAARADPELRAWLEDQIAFDRAIANNLAQLAPSQSAHADLLAKARAQSPTPRPAAWWKLAAAALFFLFAFAGVNYLFFPPPVRFAQHESQTIESFREAMALFATSRFKLDETFSGMDQSRTWLEANQFPACSSIPDSLVRLRGLGCKAIDWNGTKVGLICFENQRGETVHLFIIDAEALEGNPHSTPSLQSIAVHRELETGGWTEEDKVLLLVGSAPHVSIATLLRS